MNTSWLSPANAGSFVPLVIKRYLKSCVVDNDAVPGASIAVQTYEDFLNFNPHLLAIVSDGCFSKDGAFHMTPGFMPEDQTGLGNLARYIIRACFER